MIAKSIEKFMLSDVAADLGRRSLDPEEDLLEQRIIDSLGILKLVSHMEETYGITVRDEEIVPENFQSLNSLARYIQRKKDESDSSEGVP